MKQEAPLIGGGMTNCFDDKAKPRYPLPTLPAKIAAVASFREGICVEKCFTRLGRFFFLLVGICLLLANGGCIDELIQQKPPGKPIRHKHYAKGPLGQDKLDALLQMAMYRGRPDRYGVLVMQGRTSKRHVDPVVFSHATHRAQYTCRVCHIELEFSMKKGESGITREDYLDGRFCGACHDGRTAFSVEYACDRCHINKQKMNATYSSPEYEDLARDLPHLKEGDEIDWALVCKTNC